APRLRRRQRRHARPAQPAARARLHRAVVLPQPRLQGDADARADRQRPRDGEEPPRRPRHGRPAPAADQGRRPGPEERPARNPYGVIRNAYCGRAHPHPITQYEYATDPMKPPVYTRDGAESGRTVELDEAVFGLEPNDHVIWLDVRAAQAHGRQGTHKTKERSEVARPTRKLYRQKGTGNARVGDAKSPTRKGGGTIFGPRPHTYSVGVNKKTKQLARRSALAYKLQNDAFRVVEDFGFDAPKTRDMAAVLNALGLAGSKVLFLTPQYDET